MKNNNYLEQLCQPLNVDLTHDEKNSLLDESLLELDTTAEQLSDKDAEIDDLKAKLADLEGFIQNLISQPMSYEKLIVEAKKMQRYFYL